MSKSLPTLIKLQKSQVDEQRRLLNALLEALDRLNAEIAGLIAARHREEEAARKAEPFEQMTLADYMANLRVRLETLERTRDQAVAAVESARARLSELFETQKRYEIIRDQREAAVLAEEKRQEQMALDETAEQSHARRQRQES